MHVAVVIVLLFILVAAILADGRLFGQACSGAQVSQVVMGTILAGFHHVAKVCADC